MKIKPITFSRLERLVGHMGTEKRPTVGSSGEYWSINESWNQGFAGMKGFLNREGYGSCKVRAQNRIMMFNFEENPGLTTCQQLR